MTSDMDEKQMEQKLSEYRTAGIPCFVGFDGDRKFYYYGQFRLDGKTYFNKVTDRSDTYLDAGVKLVVMMEKYINKIK